MLTLIEIRIFKSCARINAYCQVDPSMGTTSFKNQYPLLNLMYVSFFKFSHIIYFCSCTKYFLHNDKIFLYKILYISVPAQNIICIRSFTKYDINLFLHKIFCIFLFLHKTFSLQLQDMLHINVPLHGILNIYLFVYKIFYILYISVQFKILYIYLFLHKIFYLLLFLRKILYISVPL